MCICNNHGDCKGLVMEEEVLKNFCCCNCHDSSYQLILNSIAANKIDSLAIPVQIKIWITNIWY